MGLVLCVYEDRENGVDLDGFQVGSYSDFGAWRDFIAATLENGEWGSRFQTLMMHSDCDGEWSAEACVALKRELQAIGAEMERLPALPFPAGWQRQVADELGLVPRSARECFINVDGESLVDALSRLADLAIRRGKSIHFQ
ncbi:MAG TPA: Imm70 family immunity protein [Hyphomicrobiaceae bacterium]|nr:Imm70 family immunity protein [Hyphomicrobiaceae bacterium]